MHAEARHKNSGETLRTDAPLDHAGKGENFAPTDLLATALGTCFLTVMGIKAKEKGWNLDDMSIEIETKMTTYGPRKIDSLLLQINMPSHLNNDQLNVLRKATKDCPVLRNLNDSIKIKSKWNQSKENKETTINFVPTNVFRETPQVTFFDAGVKGANGSDVVIHHGDAISPPYDKEFEQYYVHHHQIDHNLVLDGCRTFTLLNPQWDEPHHVIYLNKEMGALRIPIGTYHQSVSGPKGSTVLNQAIRDSEFDPKQEFFPVSLRHRPDLRKAKAAEPVFWIWDDGRIKRVKAGPASMSKRRSLFN